MRILRYTRNLTPDARYAVAAIGNFDGVHLGHRTLIGEAARIAKETERPLAALVFEPYPREFFRPHEPSLRLTPFRTKAHLLAGLGVDFLIVLGFGAELAAMLAQDFVMELLAGDLGLAHVVVGADFRFGKGRSGDATVLSYMGEMEGFGVTVFSPIAAAGDTKISSSAIRAALRAGKPEEAARLLGHYWSIEGHVTTGDKRGRTLGFPTANLKLGKTLHPAFGVYAVRARLAGGRVMDGCANFGVRPMFQLREPLMEVHLFDFCGDLYGQVLNVELIAYLRSEMAFESLEALKSRMTADCTEAKRVLAKRPAAPALTP